MIWISTINSDTKLVYIFFLVWFSMVLSSSHLKNWKYEKGKGGCYLGQRLFWNSHFFLPSLPSETCHRNKVKERCLLDCSIINTNLNSAGLQEKLPTFSAVLTLYFCNSHFSWHLHFKRGMWCLRLISKSTMESLTGLGAPLADCLHSRLPWSTFLPLSWRNYDVSTWSSTIPAETDELCSSIMLIYCRSNSIPKSRLEIPWSLTTNTSNGFGCGLAITHITKLDISLIYTEEVAGGHSKCTVVSPLMLVFLWGGPA